MTDAWSRMNQQASLCCEHVAGQTSTVTITNRTCNCCIALDNVDVGRGVREAHEQIQVTIIKQFMQRFFYHVYIKKNQWISDTSYYKNPHLKGHLNSTHIVASRTTDASLTGQWHIGVQQISILTHLTNHNPSRHTYLIHRSAIITMRRRHTSVEVIELTVHSSAALPQV